MSNHEPMTPTGESSVSDQGNFVAESAPHDGAGGTQHFTHARPTARTFVADHHHVAWLHLAGENGRGGAFFTVEDSRRAGETQAFLARDFRHDSLRREIAIEHDEMTVLLDRLIPRPNDVLS